MKKIVSLFLAVCMVAGMAGVGAVDVRAVGEDVTAAFTDPAFRAAVQEIIGKDVILDTDVADIVSLDVSGEPNRQGDIKSLAGLEHFIGLHYLNCRSNKLIALPALPSDLQTLQCGWNLLSTLPTLPSALKAIYCNQNSLTLLPALPSTLLDLICSGNSLRSLPTLPSALVTLQCDWNQLSMLPALPNSLNYLDCERNELLSLPTLPSSLEFLWCDFNRLTSMPALPSSLKVLWCSWNNLRSLDITGTQLRNLDCTNNLMKDESAVIGFTGEWSGYLEGGKNSDLEQYYFSPQKFWAAFPPWLQWLLRYLFFGWFWMELGHKK